MHDVLASLVRIAALVWKELVTMFRDPGSRKILIVPVLAQAVLFGYGATFNLEHVPWTYCDHLQPRARPLDLLRRKSKRPLARSDP